MITLLIDNREITVEPGTTILEAAKSLGIDIPTLCHIDMEEVHIHNNPASCRICVVEATGYKHLIPACATECKQGMQIFTSSLRVLNARRTILELILSDHPNDCLTCPKCGDCDLQNLAIRMHIRDLPFNRTQTTSRKKEHSSSIVRNMDKCIYCRRCESVCNDLQTVGALNAAYRGFSATITPAFEQSLTQSECTNCGQCVAVCPVGALTEYDQTDHLLADLANPNKIVIVQTAPAVRVALGEEFGMPPGISVTGKMVTALRRIGFDYIFDTDFAADLTIMEESAEFMKRIECHLAGDKTVPLPLLTSCCPAWVNFFEYYFPDLLDIPSSARSPQQMFGSVAKNFWAESRGIDRKKLVVVSIMPCLAKKYECSRPEFSYDNDPDVNYSLSTREIASLIKRMNIDFRQLPDEDFDMPLGYSTGAGALFGSTGGVMEAVLRTVYEKMTGETLNKLDFKQLRGWKGIRKAVIPIKDIEITVGIAHGLGNARLLLEEIRNKKCQYHAIEIMACPGGCIGGAGQPHHHGSAAILNARKEALYQEDKNKSLRKSHQNPYVIDLYNHYLHKPLSPEAYYFLHTHYFAKTRKL